jgi:hypothetical protein
MSRRWNVAKRSRPERRAPGLSGLPVEDLLTGKWPRMGNVVLLPWITSTDQCPSSGVWW